MKDEVGRQFIDAAAEAAFTGKATPKEGSGAIGVFIAIGATATVALVKEYVVPGAKRLYKEKLEPVVDDGLEYLKEAASDKIAELRENHRRSKEAREFLRQPAFRVVTNLDDNTDDTIDEVI